MIGRISSEDTLTNEIFISSESKNQLKTFTLSNKMNCDNLINKLKKQLKNKQNLGFIDRIQIPQIQSDNSDLDSTGYNYSASRDLLTNILNKYKNGLNDDYYNSELRNEHNISQKRSVLFNKSTNPQLET